MHIIPSVFSNTERAFRIVLYSGGRKNQPPKLRKNSFFLSDGTIGKFAQDKIQLLLNVVNEHKNDGQDLDPQKKELKENQDKFNYLVSLIGDTNIREYLYRKYAECCCSEKTAKIRQYEQIIVSLKNMEETND